MVDVHRAVVAAHPKQGDHIALAHLGEMPNPVDGTTRVDLEAARQIIDIVAMLRDKTKGNLDEAENALLDDALYDLRMKYVERARGR